MLKATLLGYTQVAPDLDLNIESVQDLIAYCAKVSNPQGQTNLEESTRLLNYLIKHKHWSPFEMASAVIEVETTRDIARQFLRHRSFSFQEFSQRYANPEDMDTAFVTREARLQDHKNRQNSVALEDTDTSGVADWWEANQLHHIEQSKMLYRAALERGIAKEQARAVLPEGNTVSRVTANGTIRSWIHYVELRAGNGTQKEHMDLAVAIGKAITSIFPMMESMYV
jgi:thymidylate synthase (FAD)